eukprot:15366696-Ditylum_brightwellii.AAC.1
MKHQEGAPSTWFILVKKNYNTKPKAQYPSEQVESIIVINSHCERLWTCWKLWTAILTAQIQAVLATEEMVSLSSKDLCSQHGHRPFGVN